MLILLVYFVTELVFSTQCKALEPTGEGQLIQGLNSTADQIAQSSTRSNFGRILQTKHDLSDFPQYLYDTPSHHEEHTEEASTKAPNKKRVSTTHYSYYYLGRKLWYVPLYFSIYFMFYVTALILKAITRHKIQLKHDHSLGKGRSARMFSQQMRRVDQVHQDVSRALERAHRKIYINTFG
ncbi:unnamed protein product [Acanthoscelides obtectus]|uniref:Uncharacterized protein n=1 Tax=Acanthoscelides obtectus TaxID=200917 RepID=A0A9P0Q6U0_ACAOB|nr:unnamed protein product [Acanthoscelides obtectus]CAK1627295.1 hypothetical protein AOBTE_LOCUS4492 [Acanthoscelides obtectus]